MLEEWIESRDFPGYYISNHGRVYSEKTDRILRPRINKYGYFQLNLTLNRSAYTRTVHSLVAREFCPGWDEGLQVNHINGDKLDNHEDNLEWETASGNAKHAYRMGLTKPFDLRNLGREKQPIRIIETGEVFESIAACATAIGADPSAVAKCLKNNGINYGAKGFTFEKI